MDIQPEKALPLPPGAETVEADEENPLAPIEKLCRKYGPVTGFQTRFGYTVLVSGAAEVREVLFNPGRFKRFENLRLLIGNGLLQSEGPYWRAQRRLAQPRFHQKTVETYREIMARAATEAMTAWEAKGLTDGGPFDLAREMMNVALPASLESVLGTRIESRTEELNQATFDVMYYMAFLGNPLFAAAFGADSTPRARSAMKLFDELIMDIVHRQRNSEAKDDFLSLLFAGRDPDTGEPLSDEQIRDEIATILLGGHETTSVMLMWAWYCIASNPEVEQRLHQEWEAVLGGREPTLEDVERLTYTRMTLQETLRLYPPIWGLARRALGEDSVGGYLIPKETLLITTIIELHRSPEHWDEPLRFRPERFDDGNAADIPKDTYIPFGEGPHTCIGKHFAMLEGMIAIPMIGQRYRIVRESAKDAVPHPYITLRPPGGIAVHLERRPERR